MQKAIKDTDSNGVRPLEGTKCNKFNIILNQFSNKVYSLENDNYLEQIVNINTSIK